jgi:autotransporter-associated beta strand protein
MRQVIPAGAVLVSLFIVASARATDGTWTQAGANTNYSNTANWSGGVVASGPGAALTITKSGPTIVVDTSVTIGSLTASWNSGASMSLSGASGQTLAFAASGTTPTFSIATYFSRYDFVSNLNLAGTQGLSYVSGSNALVLQSGVTWTGFSGGFTLAARSNGDGCMLYAQAANVLPSVDFTLTPGTGTNAYRHAKLVLNAGADQTLGALNSTVSGSGGTAYLSSFSSAGILTGGSVSGTNGYATLTIGSTNSDGDFKGKIGTGYNVSANAEDATAHMVNIVKTGTGTQTFSGANNYSGTTTINTGALLVTGTHAAVAVSGSDTGRYVIASAGTLGGTGTIKPATDTTAGGGVMISVAGTLAPGDPNANSGIGTLTIDGANAAKSLVALETGAKLAFDLGAGTTSDKVALTNAGANDVFFNDNTIDFADRTGGALAAGNYVLFHGGTSGTYAGLTVDGSGVITAGLAIGTGLQSYAGSALKVVGNDIVLVLAASSLAWPPTGVTVTPSTTQVAVSWTAASGATSYVVYRSTSPNGAYATVGTSTGTSFADTTITNGLTYYYKVSSVNGSGEGALSGTSASATPMNPDTLSILSVNLRAYNTYGMAVNDLAGVDRVGYWNNLVGPATTGEVVTLGSVLNHLGAALPGVTVAFTAGNTGGSYTNSGTLKFGSDAVTVGPASNDANLFSSAFDAYDTTPATLSVTGIPFSSYDAIFYLYDGGSSQGGTITANGGTLAVRGGVGNPAADGAGYVQSDDATNTSGSSVQQGNYVRFSGLSGDLAASFVAKNVGSSTQRLKIAGFQIVSRDAVPVPSQPPAAPAGLTASGGNQQVALNWTATDTATSYKIYRGGSLLATVVAPLTSYADLAVTNGTATSYAVSAVNAAGEGTKSTLASATPASPAFTLPLRTVYQYSVPVTAIYGTWPADSQRRAYLWVPPGCAKLQGVIVGLHNMLEKPMFDDPAIRQACADANLGIVFISPGDAKTWTPNGIGNYTAANTPNALTLDPNSYVSADIDPSTGTNYATDIDPATGARFSSQIEQCGAELAHVLKNLADESGYTELQFAPILLTGHSAASTFVWTRGLATTAAMSGRVFAILSYKGMYPGSIPAGMPVLHVSSEWQEISNWGNTWELGDAPQARNLRAGGATRLFGEYVQPGTGHYEYSETQSGPMADFIKSVAQLRIPANWPATAAPVLTALDPTAGWLVDVTKLGSGNCQPVAYANWIGAGKDPLRAYWYPDQATAQAACDEMNAGFSKRPQMISAYQNSSTLASLAAQSNGTGYVALSATLLGDGVSFKVRPASLSQSPVVRLDHGGPLGIGSDAILLKANGSGALKQTGADTFRVWMDRGSVIKEGQPWEPFLIAYISGDGTYRRADRPIQLTTSVPVNNVTSGIAQTIAFTDVPNQIATNLQPLTMQAASSLGAGWPVQFWVASGPYRNDENDSRLLVPDAIPPGTKFPMRVVVGSWQWGKPGVTQSAPVVFKTFWIFKTALEKWRFDNFGHYDGTTGEPVTPPGNSDDTANPVGDGIPNLVKYAVDRSPLVNADGPVTAQGAADMTIDGIAGRVLTLSFNRIADPDLTYFVEANNDLPGTWAPIWSSTGTANVAGVVTVPDVALMSDHPRRFLRLKVTH